MTNQEGYMSNGKAEASQEGRPWHSPAYNNLEGTNPPISNYVEGSCMFSFRKLAIQHSNPQLSYKHLVFDFQVHFQKFTINER